MYINPVDGLPPKPQSMNNVSMPAATPQSRSSSFSRKSNNYMNELYTMIQGNGSPQGTSEFQKVSFIPEQVTLHFKPVPNIFYRPIDLIQKMKI